jgi:class 3 adenylate cyclase
VRVDRWFGFVDLSGFTSFGDEHGDDESVRVLTLFRGAVRQVATDYGVRIAKWLGDGCMLVSVDPAMLVSAVSRLESLTHDLDLPLSMHAGCAGGGVILLEGDDYTGRSVNLAARLATAARAHEILATADLAAYATEACPSEPAGMITVAGIHDPVEIIRFGCEVVGGTVRA